MTMVTLSLAKFIWGINSSLNLVKHVYYETFTKHVLTSREHCGSGQWDYTVNYFLTVYVPLCH